MAHVACSSRETFVDGYGSSRFVPSETLMALPLQGGSTPVMKCISTRSTRCLSQTASRYVIVHGEGQGRAKAYIANFVGDPESKGLPGQVDVND